MIYKETILDVIDNTGIKKVKCFNIYKCGMYAQIGDIIRVAIRDNIPTSKVNLDQTYKAVIVRTKNKYIRSDNSAVSFSHNAVVLLNDKNDPMGTRIKGVVPKELSANVRALAEGVV